ncbi:MAG: hypothetical protein H6553_12700 [Chitinophagales bacterium]|nr:hypothetical protein [Chitinophagales bacterium]
MQENEVFEIVHQQIKTKALQKLKPIRVVINGIEGTGKTVFAQKLTAYLNHKNANVIHISIDGFHHTKAIRYQQGNDSALGYYEDAYNEQAFVDLVLKNSQKEKATIVTAIHNLDTDESIDVQPIAISNNTILITDGAYLLKPIYQPHWDLIIYLKTDFETALNRGIQRDAPLLGGIDKAIEKYNNRYHKASAMYIDLNQPEQLAHIIIDNTNFNNLIIRLLS